MQNICIMQSLTNCKTNTIEELLNKAAKNEKILKISHPLKQRHLQKFWTGVVQPL